RSLAPPQGRAIARALDHPAEEEDQQIQQVHNPDGGPQDVAGNLAAGSEGPGDLVVIIDARRLDVLAALGTAERPPGVEGIDLDLVMAGRAGEADGRGHGVFLWQASERRWFRSASGQPRPCGR